MKLVLSERFRNELRRDYLFIRERNPQAAVSVRDRIMSSIRHLKRFPQSGRSWRIPGKWELVVPGLPYIVIYEIESDAVVILSLFHTSRDFSGTFH
jgi:toxin ParE1/3/4